MHNTNFRLKEYVFAITYLRSFTKIFTQDQISEDY